MSIVLINVLILLLIRQRNMDVRQVIRRYNFIVQNLLKVKYDCHSDCWGRGYTHTAIFVYYQLD